ncbi:hypothetical protein SERLA73DRAFT_149204 [Serpula lacrymans var. lacrymans S7.3]|uniref:Uncharacterized protein n=1 Tax=Serpula lacrymans var. lacrymans (strain S7.3) TaxID=936435 RepID=F8PGQ1_SERL3|nr:hypothetical protein SERLA73DRAFT_149204 [Serpula lacrymans var. lacrymans S7.3]
MFTMYRITLLWYRSYIVELSTVQFTNTSNWFIIIVHKWQVSGHFKSSRRGTTGRVIKFVYEEGWLIAGAGVGYSACIFVWGPLEPLQVLKLLIGYNELQTVGTLNMQKYSRESLYCYQDILDPKRQYQACSRCHCGDQSSQCVWVEASDETMSKKPTHNSQETAEREASDKNAADKLDVTSEAHKDSNLHIELPDLAETGSKSVKPTARNESEIGRSGCIGLITCFALLVTIIAVLLMMQILEEDGMGTLEEIVEALVPDIDVEVK